MSSNIELCNGEKSNEILSNQNIFAHIRINFGFYFLCIFVDFTPAHSVFIHSLIRYFFRFRFGALSFSLYLERNAVVVVVDSIRPKICQPVKMISYFVNCCECAISTFTVCLLMPINWMRVEQNKRRKDGKVLSIEWIYVCFIKRMCACVPEYARIYCHHIIYYEVIKMRKGKNEQKLLATFVHLGQLTKWQGKDEKPGKKACKKMVKIEWSVKQTQIVHVDWEHVTETERIKRKCKIVHALRMKWTRKYSFDFNHMKLDKTGNSWNCIEQWENRIENGENILLPILNWRRPNKFAATNVRME